MLIDCYAENNKNGNLGQLFSGSGGLSGVGQSFTNGKTDVLDNCIVYLNKVGFPTGNIVVSIYAHSGTMGSSSKPTGPALATSDPLNVSTLTSSNIAKKFTFSGVNRITLNEATNYCLVADTSSVSGVNLSAYLQIGTDSPSPTAHGNLFYTTDFVSFTVLSSFDMIFYIYNDQDSPFPTFLQS